MEAQKVGFALPWNDMIEKYLPLSLSGERLFERIDN